MSISYAVFCRPPPRPTLFPYTTLFRSSSEVLNRMRSKRASRSAGSSLPRCTARSVECSIVPRPCARASSFTSTAVTASPARARTSVMPARSEEHTSELQSHVNLVCRLLPPTTPSYSLSLHDALPIFERGAEPDALEEGVPLGRVELAALHRPVGGVLDRAAAVREGLVVHLDGRHRQPGARQDLRDAGKIGRAHV